MIRVEPLICKSYLFLRSAERRVTVSRDAPIIWAISSCVKPSFKRIDPKTCCENGPFHGLHHELPPCSLGVATEFTQGSIGTPDGGIRVGLPPQELGGVFVGLTTRSP